MTEPFKEVLPVVVGIVLGQLTVIAFHLGSIAASLKVLSGR